ncbi:odorant receptor 4-like [Coccinella septempunctata]|uniref:odorant receptor 4-like n=1 Tax=Coccinella septempunctata TaxID=41139 RepID=UPI001D0638EA|nr:odorant receptor 4-like [Coccinella septempunctata]
MYSLNARFFIVSIFACILLLILPLIMEQKKKLPFDVWYPYDYKIAPLYIVTYAHQTLTASYVTLSQLGIDTFSAGLMAVVGCQCALLEDRMMNFDENIVDFDQLFREIADHHAQILKLAKKLNKLVSFYAFAQMGLCVLLFCTALFRLSVIETTSPEFLAVIVYIVAVKIQLFLYCWFGNEVTVYSSRLHLAAFHCNWIGSPISFQKKLILFLGKTANPIKIRAINFIPMSILTFSTIMKNSWSYFAVLQQVHNRM